VGGGENDLLIAVRRR